MTKRRYDYPDLNDLRNKIRNWAERKGFHDTNMDYTPEALILEKVCLAHSELSEFFEGHRSGEANIHYEGAKPCGTHVEITDAMIVLFDICALLNIDVTDLMEQKMEYNETRPIRHNKRY